MLYYTMIGIFLSAVGILGMGISVNKLTSPPEVPYIVTALLLGLSLIGMVVSKEKNSKLFGLAFITNMIWAIIQYTAGPIFKYLEQLPKTKLSLPPETTLKIILTLEVIPVLIFFFLCYRAIKNSREMRVAQGGDADLLKYIIAKVKSKYEVVKFRKLDTVICIDEKTKQSVTLQGRFRFTTLGVFGTTGTGKTDSVFLNLIRQDLQKLKSGIKIAITVIEPTKDLTDKVAAMCQAMSIPYIYVDPTNPDTHKFNILQGDATVAAEATRSVLSTLFGKQNPFFSQVQQTAARNTVKLLKELHGDDIDMMDVLRTLRDENKLEAKVNHLKKKKGSTDLVQYFEYEILGEMKEKYHQFAAGLRQQLEDIGGNELLQRVFQGNSDINLDRHLSEGGVFLVNTAMGNLMKKLGEVFGQYILMHVIFAIFRKDKSLWEEVFHSMYVDELAKYIGPDMGIDDLLSISRKYGNMVTLAMQSPAQLALKLGSQDASDNIMTLIRSKMVFGGMSGKDAKYFEENFGEKEVEIKQATYDNKIFVPSFWAKNYRITKVMQPRYSYTELMELKGYHMVYRIVKDAQLQPPRTGMGILVNFEDLKEANKKELRIKEILQSVKKIQIQKENRCNKNTPPLQKIAFLKSQEEGSSKEKLSNTDNLQAKEPHLEDTPKRIKFVPTSKPLSAKEVKPKREKKPPQNKELSDSSIEPPTAKLITETPPVEEIKPPNGALSDLPLPDPPAPPPTPEPVKKSPPKPKSDFWDGVKKSSSKH